MKLTVRDTARTIPDTITATTRVMKSSDEFHPGYYWNTGTLVKFTENKKLVKIYKKGRFRSTGPDF
jgi:hypothetical protein